MHLILYAVSFLVHHRGTKDTEKHKGFMDGKRMNDKEKANELSREIIDAAIEVHKGLGPGLLESAYEACLCQELALKKNPFQQQIALPIDYKGIKVENSYRVDLVVDNLVIVEIKAVEKFHKIHHAQLLTYLRLTNLWLGLLINFNVPLLKQGLKRLVLG